MMAPSQRVEVQSAFSYANLAPDTRATVEAATDRLHVLERKTGEQIIEIGKILIQIKGDIPHGQFLPWLDAEFGWSERAAQNFMAVADQFKSAKFADLKIAPSALYLIASNNVSKDIRDEFVAKAAAGQRVTHKDVKTRLAQAEAVGDDDDDDDDAPLSDFPYEVVDPDTGEVVSRSHPPQRREPDPVPAAEFKAEPLFTGLAQKPTPIPAARVGMHPDDAAIAIIALRELRSTNFHEAGVALVEIDKNASDLLDLIPDIISAISSIAMSARSAHQSQHRSI